MEFELLRDVAARHIGDTNVPGLVVLAAHRDEVHAEALGHLAIGGPPVRRDSLFRIASTTKPTTAAATLVVIEEGLLELEEPVDRLLSELVDRRVLVRPQKARGGLGRDLFKDRSWSFCQAVHASGAFGWDGGFGSSWLIDPAHHLIVIVLTQRQFETPELPRAHRDIQAAAYAALG